MLRGLICYICCARYPILFAIVLAKDLAELFDVVSDPELLVAAPVTMNRMQLTTIARAMNAKRQVVLDPVSTTGSLAAYPRVVLV